MNYLSQFTPAETLVLLEGKKASVKELLKVTFMHLLLKEVIEISTDADPEYKYVILGKKFYDVSPLKHEMVYLSPYYRSRSIRILFSHLIRMGFQNSRSPWNYLKTVKSSPNITSFFSQNLFQWLRRDFSLTTKGMEIQKKVKKEIAALEETIQDLINSDKNKAQEILRSIGGNVFLLRNIDFSLLDEIDKELLSLLNKKSDDGTNESSCTGGCYGCSLWDSGCHGGSSHSGSGDSSCAGDSGCSGCGGGCGGGD